MHLTLLLLNTTCHVLANSVGPDQLDSEEANWSGSAVFVIKYVNFYQKPVSSNLIVWKLEMGVASSFIQQGKGLVWSDCAQVRKYMFTKQLNTLY